MLCFRQVKSEVNTEELVSEFYKNLDVKTAEIESLMNTVETVTNEVEIKNTLGSIMQHILSLQEMVADAGIYLPSYDSKKSQHIIAELNDRYQVLHDKVKPKKKFGFKNKKQKAAVPDVSSLSISDISQVDSAMKTKNHLSMENSCSIKGNRSESISLERNQVQGKDVVVSGKLWKYFVVLMLPSLLFIRSIGL